MRRSVTARSAVTAALLVMTFGLCPWSEAARVKDITNIEGIRSNQLSGLGLVIGLSGTGGGDFSAVMARNMLLKMRAARGLPALDPGNMTAVVVTAELPPFAKKGSTIPVTISALDQSSSLRGGTLLLTPLTAVDGNVYAVAQGPLSVGGFTFGGQAATVQQGHPTVGTIPNGATIEREVTTRFIEGNTFTLCLQTPDATTATRIGTAINEKTKLRASVVDPGTVSVEIPDTVIGEEVMQQFSAVQMLDVTPDAQALVVINERTGTVVVGQDISISSVAVSHGNLTVITQELPQVSQPPALSSGATETVDRTAMRIIESPLREGGLTVLNRGTTVSEVARALNLLGASPRDIISIFQAMKEAGALHAEIRIM
jgi:flagellar P-ring protein precursor FlgI